MKLNDDGRQVAVPVEAEDTQRSRRPRRPGHRPAGERESPGHLREASAPSNKREYIEWITEAKTEATRTSRLETAIEWMAEGKPRNWKYMNC